jgi:hypothetical protein
MDRYSKVVLTVIAVALTFIAIKLWQPQELYAGSKNSAVGPTLGEYMHLQKAQEKLATTEAEEAYLKLLAEVPIVFVVAPSAYTNILE